MGEKIEQTVNFFLGFWFESTVNMKNLSGHEIFVLTNEIFLGGNVLRGQCKH